MLAPASLAEAPAPFALPLKRARPPHLVAGAAFLVLYAIPFATLVRDWWTQPDAGHGLPLAPVAIYLAAKRGVRGGGEGQPVLGTALLLGSVLLLALGQLAAEPFTIRLSLLCTLGALVVHARGMRQVLDWWVTAALLLLCIPLPAVLLGAISLPLQLQASAMGATLLEWRYVPVRLAGNVIYLPGQTLFVTEACSGLRSLAVLLSLGILIGALWLRSAAARFVLVAIAIPVAILLNGLRIFVTGFLTFYVSPKFGGEFLHSTEGWIVFLVAFGVLGATALVLQRLERWGGSAA